MTLNLSAPIYLKYAPLRCVYQIIEKICEKRVADYQDAVDNVLFTNVITAHSGIINKICRSFASCESDYEDLRQDALVNIWRGLPKFRSQADLKTWIYRVVLNTCVSVYRHYSHSVIKCDIKYASEQQVDNNCDDDNLQIVELLLSQLSVSDRSIIVMWLDDLSYDDIGAVMGLNRNTVATRIHRIKLKLRKIADQKSF